MTTLDQEASQISFHESSLIDITLAGTTVHLALEDALVEGARRSIEVELTGVTRVLRDGTLITALRMEKKDAEVVALRMGQDKANLVLEWNDFATTSQHTVVYAFEGTRIAMQIKSAE